MTRHSFLLYWRKVIFFRRLLPYAGFIMLLTVWVSITTEDLLIRTISYSNMCTYMGSDAEIGKNIREIRMQLDLNGSE